MVKRRVLVVFLLMSLIVCLGVYLKKQDGTKIEESKSDEQQVSFKAVGDVLLEEDIYDWLGNDYDFKDYFSSVENLLKADIMAMNQESIIGGDELGVSKTNYTFNTPTKIANQLYDLGFNMVSLANNHSLDMGLKGLNHTIQFWNGKENLIHAGLYESLEDRQKPRILEKNGIKFGFLAYTTFTNKKILTTDEMYKVGYSRNMKTKVFDQAHQDLIEQEVKQLKAQCDVVVCSMHWGNEGTFKISQQQREMAEALNKWGVDIILGSHPHVMQPIEWIEQEGHKTLVAYSLGNFISSDPKVDAYKDEGTAYSLTGVLSLDVIKMENHIDISNVFYTPMINHFEKEGNYHLYSLDDYTNELASVHARQQYVEQPFTKESLQSLVKKVMDLGSVEIKGIGDDVSE